MTCQGLLAVRFLNLQEPNRDLPVIPFSPCWDLNLEKNTLQNQKSNSGWAPWAWQKNKSSSDVDHTINPSHWKYLSLFSPVSCNKARLLKSSVFYLAQRPALLDHTVLQRWAFEPRVLGRLAATFWMSLSFSKLEVLPLVTLYYSSEFSWSSRPSLVHRGSFLARGIPCSLQLQLFGTFTEQQLSLASWRNLDCRLLNLFYTSQKNWQLYGLSY